MVRSLSATELRFTAICLVSVYSISRVGFRRVVNLPSRSRKYVTVSFVPSAFNDFRGVGVFLLLLGICDNADVFYDIKTE